MCSQRWGAGVVGELSGRVATVDARAVTGAVTRAVGGIVANCR